MEVRVNIIKKKDENRIVFADIKDGEPFLGHENYLFLKSTHLGLGHNAILLNVTGEHDLYAYFSPVDVVTKIESMEYRPTIKVS